MANDIGRQLKNASLRVSRKQSMIYLTIFVVTPILTFLTGRWLDCTFSLPEFPPLPYNLIFGFSVFFSGLATGIKSTRVLLRIGGGLPWGELNEQYQTRKLVMTGPYAYCRNPMTLGYSLLPCGMGIMFKSIGMTLFLPAIIFLSAVTWVKIREEPSLERRFGEAYREYKHRTPFLIPRIRPLISYFANVVAGSSENLGVKRPQSILFPVTLTGISLLGLMFLAVLTFLPLPIKTYSYDVLLGSIFMTICVLGAVAGVSPSRCTSLLHYRKKTKKKSTKPPEPEAKETTAVYMGHHPPCEAFSAHVFTYGRRTYCAGCVGLVSGAILSLIGSALYFLLGWRVVGAGFLLFSLGFISVVLGLLQYALFVDKASVHLLLNVVFVVGSFLLLVGVDEINGNLGLELYFLALTVYWIIDRILLSQWEHAKICTRCKASSCGFQ